MSYRASIIKSIQRGTITLNGVTTNTAPISAVVLANARLRYVGHTTDDVGTTRPVASMSLALTNSTTVTATSGLAFGIQIVAFEVVEYVVGIVKSVQRGSVTFGTPVTITSVVSAKSECDFLGYVTSGTTNTTDRARVELTNDTTVTSTSGGALSPVSFQVVEFF